MDVKVRLEELIKMKLCDKILNAINKVESLYTKKQPSKVGLLAEHRTYFITHASFDFVMLVWASSRKKKLSPLTFIPTIPREKHQPPNLIC